MIEYVCREVVHDRLMSNPLAVGYHSLSDDEKGKYLDDIMAMQYSEAVASMVNILAIKLHNRVLSMPLSLRLRHTTCRIALLYLGEE